MKRILVTGSAGQIGGELIEALDQRSDVDLIVAADIADSSYPSGVLKKKLDVLDYESLKDIVEDSQIDTVYHLASLLSASGEKKPDIAWEVNVRGLKNVLDIARLENLKIFWPSSIAVFGESSSRINTPQDTLTEPSTMYGVTKVAGEHLCSYYHRRFGVDVRSLRYPGLISYKTLPGGGTTDYAVEIFREALLNRRYDVYLKADTRMPMMYMPDAVRSTLELMYADADKIKVRRSYNITAISFSAEELVEEIKSHLGDFAATYSPDSRQDIADSWPQSIDDSSAREEWGWNDEYKLSDIVSDMLAHKTELTR